MGSDKITAFNNIIATFAVKYDCDWMPQFKQKRSLRRVLRWMTEWKMSGQDMLFFIMAHTLAYQEKRIEQ